MLLLLFGRAAGSIAPANGPWSQLALLTGGWLAAAVVTREWMFTRTAGWIPYGFGILSIVFLAAMSPDVPMAFAATTPVVLVVCGSLFLVKNRSRSALTSQPDTANAAPSVETPAIDAVCKTPEKEFAAAPTPVSPLDQSAEVETEPDTESEAGDEEAGNLWQSVQREFGIDVALTRNVTCWSSPEGEQTIVANLRCEIPGATRSTTVHVPFWPFLDATPEVFCRVIDGAEAETRVTVARPNGVAVEVTLKNPPSADHNTVVLVEIVAIGAASESSTSAA